MDFYHTEFVNPDRNAEFVKRAPERLIALGEVDPRAPNALEEVERRSHRARHAGLQVVHGRWRGESRGWNANDPMVFPLYEKAMGSAIRNHFFPKGQPWSRCRCPSSTCVTSRRASPGCTRK